MVQALISNFFLISGQDLYPFYRIEGEILGWFRHRFLFFQCSDKTYIQTPLENCRYTFFKIFIYVKITA